MAKQRTLQLYRGTTAQNNSFTGSAGELTIDTDTNELRVHDGSTAGGHIIYTKSDVDTIAGAKADDNAVVHLAGTETVTGTKTFGSTIESDIGNGGCALRYRTTRGADVLADLVQSYDKTANERVATVRAYNYDTKRMIVLGVNAFGGGAPQGVQVTCDSNNNITTACPPSDATNSILTTTAISKSSTGGYVKLGNGIIIQWGRTSEATASSARTVTYPTAFTTAPQNVQVCFNVNSNGYVPRVTSVSTTQFTVASDSFASSANPNARIRWIAIGF